MTCKKIVSKVGKNFVKRWPLKLCLLLNWDSRRYQFVSSLLRLRNYFYLRNGLYNRCLRSARSYSRVTDTRKSKQPKLSWTESTGEPVEFCTSKRVDFSTSELWISPQANPWISPRDAGWFIYNTNVYTKWHTMGHNFGAV